MCALADEVVPAHIAAAIRQGEPVGDVAFHKYPTSRWRRYHKLASRPAPISPREFNAATAKSTFPVWTMNAIADLVMQRAAGPMPWWYRPMGGLFDQFLGAAETDPLLAEWFLRRSSLLDSLTWSRR
jgi:hypothetical protein